MRGYTDRADVKQRSDEKLAVDIARAQSYIAHYTNCEYGPDAPVAVKTSAILLAEYYAGQQAAGRDRALKSEKLDDYAYTVADDADPATLLGLHALLSPHIKKGARAATELRLRRL